MVRRMVLREAFKDLETIILPTTLGLKWQIFTVPFGLRGKPTTRSSATRRTAAVVTAPTTTYVDPNQAMGNKLGTKPAEIRASARAVAEAAGALMRKQVKSMVRAALLICQREAAKAAASQASPAAAAIPVDDDLRRMEINIQCVMQALKRVAL